MNDHIPDLTKMIGDTPISDSTPHNVAELGMLCRRLERLAAVRLDYITQLEAKNDAANAEIERLTSKVAQLYRGAEEQKQRIKRLEDYVETLEECGDSLFNSLTRDEALERWKRAKEAKP